MRQHLNARKMAFIYIYIVYIYIYMYTVYVYIYIYLYFFLFIDIYIYIYIWIYIYIYVYYYICILLYYFILYAFHHLLINSLTSWPVYCITSAPGTKAGIDGWGLSAGAVWPPHVMGNQPKVTLPTIDDSDLPTNSWLLVIFLGGAQWNSGAH